MPRFFEVNTDTEVLCYIPSGKITDKGQQKIQFMQDGGTCWFYAPKRLANATGFKFKDPTGYEKYRLILNFRKTQGRLDSAVLIAANLLAKNCPDSKIYNAAGSILFTQRSLIKAFQYAPRVTQTILDYINPGVSILSRQLNDLENDIKLIQELVSRYRTYNKESIHTYNQETIEAIRCWLMGRNPYQSQLLECACLTADGLSKLNSTEFSGTHAQWSQEPRKLIVHTTKTSSNLDSFLSEFMSKKSSVIILGAGPEVTNNSDEQLSVAQKQERRSAALKEFNQKIFREMFNTFDMQATSFQSPEELRDKLKANGPLIISGYYGKSSYTTSAHPLKDSQGNYQTLGTRMILGWSPKEVKQADKMDPYLLHAILIIGIKYNSENPNLSRVLFLDPTDSSFPNEKRKTYSMSFERLLSNRSPEHLNFFTVHYSNSDMLPEIIYKKETQKKQVSNARNLLKFGLVASLGVAAAAGAVYTVYNSVHANSP